MFELLGISLALAALLTINALVSLGASLLWRTIETRAGQLTATTRSSLIFALRFFPMVTAVVIVAAFFLPAYIIHEPRQSAEKVSVKLAVIAALSAAGLFLALWRGLSAWIATRRLINNWLQNSAPIELDQVSIPAYRLRHPFPVIAVVGAFRRRLFIADHLFELLSDEEIAAAIAHECGHLTTQDNLKRALLQACRDVLAMVPCGRALDRAWAESSESAADEYAARSGGEAALNMASALVKIARMAPAGIKPATPVTVSLIGDDASLIARRVERLMQLAAVDDVRQRQSSLVDNYLIRFCLSLALAALALSVFTPNLLSKIHGFIEIVVSVLQ